MTARDIIAQAFGLIGLFIVVYSYQAKENKNFFLFQALGSIMFFLNFIMINAIAGALFNLVNFIRGILFKKDAKKIWKLIVLFVMYTGCFAFSVVTLKGDIFNILLSSVPYIALMIMSVFMWKGNGKHIRYSQIFYMSPAWIIYNIFNFTLGGLICESFSMVSSIIALIRYRKTGFTE